ncbi:Septin-14 [Ceratocystis platani]|uniref:Septin-14 n=1 Tax=Ceratocystis fimbriata f. sp. platani TaxID=88771 RepID=A0A0F8B078_CERFI|nr:Septin-14 [Ceratocystis platani]
MLLRRSKSSDLKSKKAREQQELLRQQQQKAIPKMPPKLPEFNKAQDQLSNAFGATHLSHDAVSIVSVPTEPYSARTSMEPGRYVVSKPPPPVPQSIPFDPYARTESMTHRGRYSYASSAISTINSPRRVRRRKDPTPFNILVIGSRNSGKTSFLEFLKTALALPPKKRSRKMEDDEPVYRAPQGNFIPHYLETEIDNERIGLTLWDSEGLEKNVVDLQLREMLAFLESKFEDTFTEEMKVVRSPGVQDTHIHAVFLVLDPVRLDQNISASRAATNSFKGPHARVLGGLDEDLDLQVLRTLNRKTTVIPVISKADTITSKHMAVLKKSVAESLKRANIDPLSSLGLNEDGSDSSCIDETDEYEIATSNGAPNNVNYETIGHAIGDPNEHPSNGAVSDPSHRNSVSDETPMLPLSIISPDLYEPGVMGRQFPWGFADPYNEEHCDFIRLKEAVFSEWRGDLRELSREQWYEGWRTSRLKLRTSNSIRR